MRSLPERLPRAMAWAVLATVSGLTACTGMRTVDTAGLASGQFANPGDTVRVTTTDDRVLRFKVTAVSDRAITGERPASRAHEPDSGFETGRSYPDLRREVVVPMASIEKLKVRTLDSEDPSDTTALFWRGFASGYVGTIGGVVLLAAAILAGHFAGAW